MLKWLLTLIVALVLLSALTPWLRRLGFGRLPGDLQFKRNGKSYFTKIGVAFPAKNGGGGYSVLLDAMPAPIDGQFKILLMVPKPRDDRQQGGGRDAFDQRDVDDSVPF